MASGIASYLGPKDKNVGCSVDVVWGAPVDYRRSWNPQPQASSKTSSTVASATQRAEGPRSFRVLHQSTKKCTAGLSLVWTPTIC